MPEIANAVICPDTGKSLRHQELIAMLRYKIKWMRSTANKIRRLYKTNTIRFIRKSDYQKYATLHMAHLWLTSKNIEKKDSEPDSQWEGIKLNTQVRNLLAQRD
jgi:hypothetical protein